MMSCVWRALGGAVGLEGSALTRVTFFFFSVRRLLSRTSRGRKITFFSDVVKHPDRLRSCGPCRVAPLVHSRAPAACTSHPRTSSLAPTPPPSLKCFRVFFNDAVSDGRSTSATPSAPTPLRASPSLRLTVCVWVGSSCEALGICPLYSTSTSKCMIWVFPS